MSKLQIKHTEWNLKPLFESDNDPKMEAERKVIEENTYKFINKWKNREDYLKDPEILKEALEEYELLQRKYGTSGNQGYYFWLRTQQDENNPELKAKFNKIDDFGKKLVNEINFFELRIAKIPKEKQGEFLSSPELSSYKHFLQRLFDSSKYLLTEDEEKIMTLKSSSAHSNWVKMVSGFLSKEEREVINHKGKKELKSFAEISSLLSDKNQRIRDSAAEAFNDILKKYVDVAEAEINAILGNKKVDDELRKLPRPDAARHLGDDIESHVVDALVEAVSQRNDIAKRYYKLKSKLFGVPKLQYHERNVEYGKVDKKYTYQEALDLVYETMTGLDEKFGSILKNFVENGFIDAFPRKGKRDGAFCAYNMVSQPTYTLLNYTDKLNDILTIAHELGHGINDELMKEKQNSLSFGTPLSTAEVASTFMEDFVLQRILKDADDELKLTLLMQKLNADISTISRQIACYRFEQELHSEYRSKGYLSKEEIGKIFQKHMINYMGDYVEQSEGAENWWVYWSHIRSFFYVYSYASGLLISKSLQNFVKNDPGFIEKVKEFLSAGLSDSPKNIFMKMGIDITDKEFWNKGLDEVESLLEETERLAKKLKKI